MLMTRCFWRDLVVESRISAQGHINQLLNWLIDLVAGWACLFWLVHTLQYCQNQTVSTWSIDKRHPWCKQRMVHRLVNFINIAYKRAGQPPLLWHGTLQGGSPYFWALFRDTSRNSLLLLVLPGLHHAHSLASTGGLSAEVISERTQGY